MFVKKQIHTDIKEKLKPSIRLVFESGLCMKRLLRITSARNRDLITSVSIEEDVSDSLFQEASMFGNLLNREYNQFEIVKKRWYSVYHGVNEEVVEWKANVADARPHMYRVKGR